MNKLLKIITPLLGLVFLVLLVISVSMMVGNPFSLSNRNRTGDERSNSYAFFLPSSDYAFFNDLKNGALEAADALDCAIIFHSTDPDSLSLRMASYSGVNGIAVFSYEKNDTIVGILKKISLADMPIVQIENEVVNGPDTFLIGTNSFDSGKSIGKIALMSDKPDLNAALIYSDKNPGMKDEAGLVEIGLKSVMGGRLSQLHTEKTGLNPIDAERVFYELLQKNPNINMIILTDANDTLVTVQSIIDLNLVGRIQIIGFGDDKTVRDYIDKGVVLGSIVRNARRIGYSAVMALKEISTIGYTSAYVDTGITIITKQDDPRNGPISRSGI